MRDCDVRSPEQALAYMTDCTLATVQSMAMLKSRKKSEFERQISMAQKAVNWAKDMGVDVSTTRAQDVIDAGGSVAEWVEPYITIK